MIKITLFFLYPVLIFALFLYSYTQVDLNLTLSTNPILISVQRFFQNIGYFQRPLSTAIFVSILLFLFLFYLLFLKFVNEKSITKRQVWLLILATSLILTFSYNAFSYDLFNYIFDAKILTHYHQNPYLHKALDFTGDSMLLFMRWTHRTYPYGPTWLGLTVPISFLGLKFLPTLFLFKALATASFLGTVYFIGKILRKISPKNEIFGLVFFGLSPLVLIESLVSSHNDIPMVFFAVLSLYLLIRKKTIFSFLSLLLSIGVKFATVFLIPVWGLKVFRKDLNWDKFFLIASLSMISAIVVASVRTSFQPWYLLYALPFAAFIAKKYYVLIPSIVLSFTSLLIYVPFLYMGDWDPPIPMILLGITTTGIAASILGVLGFKMIKYNHV